MLKKLLFYAVVVYIAWQFSKLIFAEIGHIENAFRSVFAWMFPNGRP